MRGPTGTDLARAGLAVLLLLAGVAGPLWGWHELRALDDPAGASTADDAFGVYYRSVVLKGMLPQLLLALPLHPWLRRFRRRHAGPALADEAARPGDLALHVETFVLATLAYCAVAPTLLAADWPDWPALHMRGPGERIGTYLGMTTAVTLAIRLAARWPRTPLTAPIDRADPD